MIKKIFLTLLLLIAVFAVVVALQPAEYSVSRPATINASPAVVFAHINDFHAWQEWSPWLKLDPNAATTYEGAPSGKGAAYSWSGNDKIGQGRMTILESQRDSLVRIKLDFIKPFASTAVAEFTIQPQGGQTLVTWAMSGRKNYVSKAFCMFKNMDSMVGGDFERGLARLKAACER